MKNKNQKKEPTLTKKVSKKATKKDTRKDIEKKLESVLSNLKNQLGEKKFKRRIKKAGKLFSAGISRPARVKEQEAKKSAKLTVSDLNKPVTAEA